jgi:multiple sugar transport system permease protein
MAIGSRALEATGLRSAGRLTRVREWWEQEHVFGYGLILPAFVLIACLVAYPFGMAIYFSLSDYWVGSPGPFVGLGNFREIVANEVFRQTVWNSFVFTGIALTLKAVLGVWLALLLARNLRGKRLLRGAVLLPWVIPTALSTLGWGWMFDSLYSVVNWTAIRLVAIPREYYEAAEVDGASSVGRFRHVTLPLLKPVLAVVLLFSTIFTFNDFNIVYVLTRGGPVNTTHLFATLAYQTGLAGGNLGQGAAISLFMLPLLGLVVFFQLRYIRRE